MKRLILALLFCCLPIADASAGGYWYATNNCGGRAWYEYPIAKAANQYSTVSHAANTNTLSIVNNFQYAQPSALQGSTLYGSLNDPYNLDLGALLTLHNRTISQGIDGMTGLGNQYAALLADEGERRGRVAEIRAKGEAAERTLNASNAALQRSGGGGSLTLQGQFNSGRGDYRRDDNNQVQHSESRERTITFPANSLVMQTCGRCHTRDGVTSSKDALDYLDVDQALNDKQLKRAIHSIVMDNVACRMPKGQELSAEEVRKLIRDLSEE